MRPINLIPYPNPYQNLSDHKIYIKNKVSKISFNTKILVFLSFFLVVRITILIRRRSAEDFSVIDSFAILEIAIVIMTIFFLFLNPYLKHVINRISKSSASILFAYCIMSILSALWSPLSSYTLFRAVQVASQLLVIFVVIYEFGSFESAENFVLRAALLLMIINLLGQFKLVNYSLSLSALHSNTYSNSAAMIFCYCFHEYFVSNNDEKKRFRKYIFLSLLGMVMGTSATSNIAALVSIFTARFVFYKKIPVSILILSAMVVISVSFFSQNILNRAISDIVLVGKNPHTIRTLSGRMHIWKTYIEVAKEKPILGHGFAITTRIGKFRVNNAHNLILAIVLDLGIVGLGIFLWGAQRLARECIPSSQQGIRGQLGSLGVFIAVFVACQSTPFIATHWHAPNAVFTLFFALHTLYLRPLAPVASLGPPLARPRHGRIVRDVRSRPFRQPLLH